jgi:hypothetical protein
MTTPTLGFFNCVSTKKRATEQTLINIRELYPDSYFLIACDATESYMDLCEKYNCEYFHSQNKVGYPVQPYGYTMENVLDWLSRFYFAAVRTPTTHLMMMEDDILVNRKIDLNADWEIAGPAIIQGQFEPHIPETVMELIYQFSGKYPNVNHYGGGGGTIFKVSTFLDNYTEIVKFLKTSGRIIQNNIYPTIGWIDCFMTIFYYLCGKELQINPRMISLYNCHTPEDYDNEVLRLQADYDIICHYKKHY